MKHPHWILAGLLAGGITATVAAVSMQQQKGGTDDFGPYTPVAGWAKVKPVRPGEMDRGCSVFVESPNRIWYTTDVEFPMPQAGRGAGGGAARGGAAGGGAAGAEPYTHVPRVMVLDANGNVIEEWTQWEHLFNMPHAVRISPYDPEKNVWIVDRDNSQIFKFTHDGKKLLMTLGEKGVIASDDTHLGRPSDISFAPDGSFYVSDGYANTRVIKFDKDGKRLLTWGTPGDAPGQFNVQVHDVAVDAKGRVYVGDRGNDRVQVFDANGKFLDQWRNIQKPSFIWVTKDGHVWVAAGVDKRLVEFDMNGKLLTYWGTYGLTPGKFDDPHDFSVDPSGNLYVADWSLRKVGLEKYSPTPGADRSRMVGVSFNRSVFDHSAPKTASLVSPTH